jgi:hypothetical protein
MTDPQQIRDVAMLAVVCLFGLAAFTVWFLKDVIGDLRKQRDGWQATATSAVEAFNRLVDQLDVEPVVRPKQGGR